MKFTYNPIAHTHLPNAPNDVYSIPGTIFVGNVDEFIQFFIDMKNCPEFAKYKSIELAMDAYDPHMYIKLTKVQS